MGFLHRAAFVCLTATTLLAQSQLRIFAIDTEGGKSTLYVAPSGESMLIDTGYAGARDVERILAAVNAAGVKQIDALVITHFHADHAGGAPELLGKLKVKHLYDHGELGNPPDDKARPVFDAYAAARKNYPHTTLKVGDTIPVKDLRVEVVAANGKSIAKALPGAGKPNPVCTTYQAIDAEPSENDFSLGLMIRFGDFRVSDLGDIMWNQEHDLVCPDNKLGTVDLYMTTHHGTKTSGSPQIVHALHPRVVLMNNGATKGGSELGLKTIHASPGLIDLWQIHYSNAGQDLNAPEQFLANPKEPCEGKWLEVTASRDGTFTVTNGRTGFSKTYKR